jgi:phosphopantothenoylcysteine decarboxylase/phosphopantothenate--cysteine ligase
MLHGKKIIVAVSGSIAAYKAAYLVRSLIKQGADIQVVMTQAATEFISPLTLSTLSKKEVYTDIISEKSWNNHVELALWADLMIVAPATANTLAKMAVGLCDDMVTACYLSSRSPVLVAPAMDLDMWKHPATMQNIKTLTNHGVRFAPVEHGELASGLSGLGRMAKPEHIVSLVSEIFKKKSDSPLAKQKILVTAGPTYEEIDPVRFIGNRSSGKMGLAIVQSLLDHGAEVELVLGPNHLEIPTNPSLQVYHVVSAAQMAEKAKALWPGCRAAIFAAAVADYTPATRSDQKIKKADGTLDLSLVRTEDIALALGQIKQDHQITVGFALETENEDAHARRKISKKNFDFIVLNSLNDAGAGFQHDTNKVSILLKDGQKLAFPLKTKTEVAEDIVDVLENLLNKRT